eukprot:4645064-Amphidinium_carterae.1
MRPCGRGGGWNCCLYFPCLWEGKRRLLPPGKLPVWMDRGLSGVTPWIPQLEQERLQTCYLYLSKEHHRRTRKYSVLLTC